MNMNNDNDNESAVNFRDLFTQQIKRPEEDLEMDRAALYLAGEEYPELNVDSQLGSLDSLAQLIMTGSQSSASPAEQASHLGRYLFEELGFKGNTEDYYSPDNSYFNRVLETKVGIPITLSLLVLEIGRRIGLRCRGVGLPGQ